MRLYTLLPAILLVPAAAAQSYDPPRTRDGHPDMQGVWLAEFITGVERPEGVKDLVASPEVAKKMTADSQMPDSPVIDPDFHYYPVTNLLRVRGELRTSMVVTPADGMLPFSEAGSAGAERSSHLEKYGFDNPEERPTYERCLAGQGQAPIRPLPIHIPHQIVQTPDALVIWTEDVAGIRIVDMSGRAPPPAMIRTFEGYSAGRWDGDTLVIETTHIRSDDPYRSSFGRAIMVGPGSKVVERLSRLSNSEMLFQYSVEDPKYYEKPWMAEFVLTLTDDDAVYEYACHEANYAMTNMLRAGRLGRQPKPGEKKPAN